MTMPAHRPRGRRPGHDDTRGTIREAAARLFERDGYDRVSLRAIARAAEVDPALVHHYYRSKADLYAEAAFQSAWDRPGLIRSIQQGPTDQVGRRAARSFLELWETDEERRDLYLSTLDRSAGRGRHALNEVLAREVFTPVAAGFGHSNAAYRGQLAASALLGVMMARHHLEVPLLRQVSLRPLIAPLGATLQHYLVDPW